MFQKGGIVKEYYEKHLSENLNKYENMSIIVNEDSIMVVHDNTVHIIQAVIDDFILKWHMEPYLDSYFTTEIYANNSFDLVIAAIKDHSVMHK